MLILTEFIEMALCPSISLIFKGLKPRLGYVPKVLSTPFRAQVIALSAKMYIERSALYRKSEQLFVGFGNHAKGGPVMKQRISRWLVDAITLA